MKFEKEKVMMSTTHKIEKVYRIGGYVKRAKLNLRNEGDIRAFHRGIFERRFGGFEDGELVDVYIDITGYKETCKRPEMLRLMRDCAEGKVNLIFAETKGYLAANTREFCYAPRYSPLIDSVRGFLLKRREYVQSQLIATGYTDVNVDELPIACMGNDFFKRCSADDLTDAAREIFRQLGFKRETLCAINRQRMIENADLRETMENGASDIIEPDLTAYILRRTYATHLAAIGMEQSKIEYLIGHMIQDPYDSRNDLSHEDYLYEMKKQLEKRPLVGSNCLNTDVIALFPGECVTSTQSHTQTFTVSPDISCVQLSVTAKEPGDALQVTVSPTTEDVPIYKECGLYAKTTNKYPRTIDIDKINQHLYEYSSSKRT